MHKTVNEQGFPCIGFTDYHRTDCSLMQFQSDIIWLGIESTKGMHLTQQHVADLIPLLQRFVDTGELSDVPDDAPTTQELLERIQKLERYLVGGTYTGVAQYYIDSVVSEFDVQD